MRILFAEADPGFRSVLSRTLQQKGFEVVAIEDGVQVLDILIPGHSFDCLITANRMRESSGLGILQRLHYERRLPSKAILLSGDGAIASIVASFGAIHVHKLMFGSDENLLFRHLT